MDKEHVKGTVDKAKGAIKDATGKVLDDKEMQAKGKMDKAKGEGHGRRGRRREGHDKESNGMTPRQAGPPLRAAHFQPSLYVWLSR